MMTTARTLGEPEMNISKPLVYALPSDIFAACHGPSQYDAAMVCKRRMCHGASF
jgi:hypothetical protein